VKLFASGHPTLKADESGVGDKGRVMKNDDAAAACACTKDRPSNSAEEALVPDIARKPLDEISSFVS
jgi:hypothetical protein